VTGLMAQAAASRRRKKQEEAQTLLICLSVRPVKIKNQIVSWDN
jgi:hypothetical protein